MQQKKSKPVKDRAIGLIGPGAVNKLTDAGILLMDRETVDKLYRELDALREARYAPPQATV